MKKISIVLFLFAFAISGCGAGQIFGPAFTPTPTITPVPTNTATTTPTFTPTVTSTATRTITPTSLPGIGVRPSKVIGALSFAFTFSDVPDIDGGPAKKGINDKGYSSITLIGAPYLTKAILSIDLSREDSMIATGNWIIFLAETAPGGKETADWVHGSFPEAEAHGKVEKVFGNVLVTLQSNPPQGTLFLLTVSPTARP